MIFLFLILTLNYKFNDTKLKFKSFQIDYINETIDLDEEIGHGRFSTVFKGKLKNGTIIAAKKLKPQGDWRLKREISVLTKLQNVSNVIHLYGVYGNEESPIIATEYIKKDDKIIPSYENLKWLMRSILIGINGAHNLNIFHRDIKWQNILFSFDNHVFRIIDWGLADYDDGSEYNYNIGTKSYKAPELLFKYKRYNKSIDIWACGCLMANIILGIPSFFNGADNQAVLYRQANFFGQRRFEKLAERYKSKIDFPYSRSQTFYEYILPHTRHLITNESINFLTSLLTPEPERRIKASEALQDPFLK